MGILKHFLQRVSANLTAPYEVEETEAETEDGSDDGRFQETSTTMINTKELFKDGYFFRCQNIYETRGDEQDKGYWWCYAGNPELEGRRTSPWDSLTIELGNNFMEEKRESGDIPVFSIPSHIMEVFRILERPDFDYMEIANIIDKNPSLTGMFINSINSSLYNRGFTITELYPALLRLGKNNIRSLLQLYAVKISFSSDKRFGSLAQRIIRHSYITAVIAGYLSQRYFPEPGQAFIAGLLHDVGKLAILKQLSLNEDFCRRLNEKNCDAIFDAVFAMHHTVIGHKLGLQWQMDDLSLAAIERHHKFWEYDFSDENQLDYHVCLLINLSDTMARILGEGRPIKSVNIFLEPATVDLNIEKDFSTIEFFNEIPEIVVHKAKNQLF